LKSLNSKKEATEETKILFEDLVAEFIDWVIK
jgi:hypothetical protein